MTPQRAILDAITLAVGEVQYATWRLDELASDDPYASAWLEVRRAAAERLGRYSRLVIAIDGDERLLRLAEARGVEILQAILALVADQPCP